jgi:Ras-related protein Rab-1A
MADEEKSMGKLVLIGDSGVGKSSMFSRFFQKRFTDNTLPTLGVEYKIKNLEIDGKMLKLMIWDTSGQEKYNSIAKNFYQYSHGMMVVFSLTDRQSFDHVDKWLERVYNDAPKDVCIMLVGRVQTYHQAIS